jgi:hypothetical protein
MPNRGICPPRREGIAAGEDALGAKWNFSPDHRHSLT